jgi:hypothetical protein
MMKRLACAVAAVALLLGSVGQARADVISSNLGPGDTYDRINGRVESGPDIFPVGATRQAVAFTVTGGDFRFDSAQLGLTFVSGTNAIDLRLYSDAGGEPGTVLETFHATGLPAFGSTDNTLTTFTSALHSLLQAGQEYWLLPFASGDTGVAWNDNSTGANSVALSHETEPTTWQILPFSPQGAFRVNGSPAAVPEPSTLTLLGLGTLALLGYGRQRRMQATS